MTADPRLTWGTSTSPRPEPLADRRYPRCGRMRPEHAWHGLPVGLPSGEACRSSIEDANGPQIDAEAVA